MFEFEGRLAVDINGEAAIVTAQGCDLQVEALRPLHFLAAAGVRLNIIQTLRQLARQLVATGVRITMVHRGKQLASIGVDVRQDAAAQLLGIEHARFGSAIATLFRR